MSVSAAEQHLTRRLRTSDAGDGASRQTGSVLLLLDQVSPGVWRHWYVPFPVLLNVPVPGDAVPVLGDAAVGPGPAPAVSPAAAPEARLREALSEVGLAPDVVELFAVAALTALTPGTTLHRLLTDPADGPC